MGRPSKNEVVPYGAVVNEQAERYKNNVLFQAYPLVMCGFPYQRLPPNPDGSPVAHWERVAKVYDAERHERGTIRLVLGTADKDTDIAYGTMDRLLLIWFQTKAVQQESPVVRWSSHREFLDTFDLGGGGANYNRYRRAFKRLTRTTILIEYQDKYSVMGGAQTLLDGWMVPSKEDCRKDMGGEMPLFDYCVTLAPRLYDWLMRRAIVYRLDVVRHFTYSPMALDLILFIHHRLILDRDSPKIVRISWSDLRDQLGSNCKDEKALRREIRKALKKLPEVWPEIQARLLYGGTLELCQPTDGKFLDAMPPPSASESGASSPESAEAPPKRTQKAAAAPSGDAPRPKGRVRAPKMSEFERASRARMRKILTDPKAAAELKWTEEFTDRPLLWERVVEYRNSYIERNAEWNKAGTLHAEAIEKAVAWGREAHKRFEACGSYEYEAYKEWMARSAGSAPIA